MKRPTGIIQIVLANVIVNTFFSAIIYEDKPKFSGFSSIITSSDFSKEESYFRGFRTRPPMHFQTFELEHMHESATYEIWSLGQNFSKNLFKIFPLFQFLHLCTAVLSAKGA